MEISGEDITTAAAELQEVVALKLGDLADRLTGAPEFGTEEWKAQHEARDTPEGHTRLRRWHLVKLQIAREAGVDQTGNVLNARRFGATWEAIGEACGITRQAAYDRWAKYSNHEGDEAVS